MKCFHCKKKIENELDMILISADGDFVCSKECQEGYEKEKDRFFSEIVHDEEKCRNWLMGQDV